MNQELVFGTSCGLGFVCSYPLIVFSVSGEMTKSDTDSLRLLNYSNFKVTTVMAKVAKKSIS